MIDGRHSTAHLEYPLSVQGGTVEVVRGVVYVDTVVLVVARLRHCEYQIFWAWQVSPG
jgi:hypothetical protein